MSQPDQVDIIVPTYQGANYIAELIESLLSQTYPHFRILVRDDGSKDQTVDILKSYVKANPKKVFMLDEPKQNLGIMGNYAELLKNVRSDYIFLADQDDSWLPNKIEWTMQVMKKMERQFGMDIPLLVHTDLKVVDQRLKEISPSYWRYANLKPEYATTNRLLLQNCVTGCTVVINRALMNKMLPISKEAIMHDWWMALVASCFGHIQYCDRATILYRQHSGNTLGAVRDNWLEVIKGRFQRKPENVKAKIQAKCFLNQFEHLLNSQTKEMIQAFCNIKEASYISQRKQMINYGFFKHSTFRNLGRLFLPFRY